MATTTVNVSEPKFLNSTEEVSLQAAEASAAVDNNEPIVNDVQKKMKRAERFGMPVQLSEEEKRSSRAERFGSAANSKKTDTVKGSEEQKKKARAERFGISTEVASDEEAKKKARLARFAGTSIVDNVEDDKRKARSLRFSQSSAATVSKVNDEGKLVQGATAAGEAGGAA